MTQTNELFMLHGRKDPDAVMDGWGFNGPTLTGITSMNCTYGAMVLYFDSKKSRKKARKATGWLNFGDDALEMETHGDLLAIHPKGKTPSYFGDWTLTPDLRKL